MRDSRHESSLPNKLVHSVKIISAVTTPDFSGRLTSPSTINDGDVVFPVQENDGDVVFPVQLNDGDIVFPEMEISIRILYQLVKRNLPAQKKRPNSIALSIRTHYGCHP